MPQARSANCNIDLKVVLSSSWAVLGSSWGRLGPSWERLGVVLGCLGRVLGYLGLSWAALGCQKVAWAKAWHALWSPNQPFGTQKVWFLPGRNDDFWKYEKTKSINQTIAIPISERIRGETLRRSGAPGRLQYQKIPIKHIDPISNHREVTCGSNTPLVEGQANFRNQLE